MVNTVGQLVREIFWTMVDIVPNTVKQAVTLGRVGHVGNDFNAMALGHFDGTVKNVSTLSDGLGFSPTSSPTSGVPGCYRGTLLAIPWIVKLEHRVDVVTLDAFDWFRRDSFGS